MADRQVVVLGARFGGLYAGLHLERALRRERSVRIVLLDKENYHLFVPMLMPDLVEELEIDAEGRDLDRSVLKRQLSEWDEQGS